MIRLFSLVSKILRLLRHIAPSATPRPFNPTCPAGVFALTIGANFISIVGPVISTGIAIADSFYGEEFYNYMENKYGN